jgi:hypothetical protein
MEEDRVVEANGEGEGNGGGAADAGSPLNTLATALTSTLGGVVIVVAIIAIVVLGVEGIHALPSGSKAKDVAGIIGAITTVIGTMVGGYAGARIGASAGQATTENARHERHAESVRLQEALSALDQNEAHEAMQRADTRLRQSGHH